MGERFCIYPLTTLNLTWPKLYPCCSSSHSLLQRMMLEVDPLSDPDSAWNSDKWSRWRRRIGDDDYASCEFCQQRSDWVDESELREKFPEVADDVMAYRRGDSGRLPYPHTVILSFDTSCNLTCVTCRPRGLPLSKTATTDMTDNVAPYLVHAKRVVIAGEGEVAVSPAYQKLLCGLTGGQRITVMSNGTLLNEEFWGSLPQSVIDNIDRVHISCDGTTNEVYESIRIGGDFGKWLANMGLLHDMKTATGWTTKLMYTVSKANFADMRNVPAFAENIGFDELYMAPAARWSRKLNDSTIWVTEAQLDDARLRAARSVCNSLTRAYKKPSV